MGRNSDSESSWQDRNSDSQNILCQSPLGLSCGPQVIHIDMCVSSGSLYYALIKEHIRLHFYISRNMEGVLSNYIEDQHIAQLANAVVHVCVLFVRIYNTRWPG